MAVYDVTTTEKKASPSLVAGGTLYADNPLGTILPFGGSSVPSGWLLCDGTAVSRTTYSELFAVIGESFGAGDGSTTFNLPDMREAVPKGAGLTGHTVGDHLDVDGLAVGEFLDDRIQEHLHDNPNANAAGNPYEHYPYELASTKNGYTGNLENRINSGRRGATTEVKSVGVNYIIKAKMASVPSDFLAKVDEIYGDIIPSDASASNKLVTHQTPYGSFTLNNDSGTQKWYKLGTYMSANNTARLDFVSARVDGQMFESSIRISGNGTDANYVSWIGERGCEISTMQIKVDTNRNIYVKMNSYSAVEIRVYGVFTLNITELDSEPSGVDIALQKLATESDLNKAITVTASNSNIVVSDARLVTNNLAMVSGYIKSGTQLAFNTSQVDLGTLSVSGRTIRGTAPCSLFLFSLDLFGTNGPNTIQGIWKANQSWLSIGRDVTNSPTLSEDSWFTAMLPLE